jgi:drug/metabolite transporter (DMT)-like permease
MALTLLRMRPLHEAAVCVLSAEALLSLMDAILKGLAVRYPTMQLAFLRFGFGSIWATVLIAIYWPGRPSRETVIANASRSVLVVITACCFFFALSKLPLAETAALSFLSPLLMVVFGAAILGEKLDRSIGIGLAAGLIGMALIVGQKFGDSAYEQGALWGVAAVLLATVTYALNIIVLRQRAQRDPALTIVWFQSVCPALLLLIPAALVWMPTSTRDLGLFTLVGALAVGGHYMLALAFARAGAARLAPLHYTTLVWGIAFGYLLFAEVPTLVTLCGATLIAMGAWIAQHKSES